MRREFDDDRPHFKKDRPAYLVWLLRKSLHEFGDGKISVSQLTDDVESVLGSLIEIAGSHSIDTVELAYLWGELEEINGFMHYRQRTEPTQWERLETQKIIEGVQHVLSQAGFANHG